MFVAGGIFDSDDIKKMIDLGAFGVQIATRFIATEECDASQALKEIILQAADGDVGILKSPVGMPGRGLLSPLAQRARIERIPPKKCIRCISTCDCNTTPYCINQALIDAFYGQYESGLFFCGSNVGRINQITTVPKLIKELMGG